MRDPLGFDRVPDFQRAGERLFLHNKMKTKVQTPTKTATPQRTPKDERLPQDKICDELSADATALTEATLRESEGTRPKPTKEQQRIIQRHGTLILSELAYGIRDKCRTPFTKDGNLTKEGKEAALEILDNTLYACGDGEFFDDVTEDLLSTFPAFYDHEPETE